MATLPRPRTSEDMREFLANLLSTAAGGTRTRWRRLIHRVERRASSDRDISDWQVTPRGTDRQRAAIETAVARVRADHPFLYDDAR